MEFWKLRYPAAAAATALAMYALMLSAVGFAEEEPETGKVREESRVTLLGERDYGGREFNSELSLTVLAKYPEEGEQKRKMVGMTPSEVPVWVPDCEWWLISPLGGAEQVDWEGVVQEIRDKKIPGLTLPPNATNEDLAHIEGVEQLRVLNLTATDVTDKGLATVASLNNLELLDLRYTDVTAEALKHVKSLDKLRRLDLSMSSVEGEGLAYLKKLSDLRSLQLISLNITDGHLAHLEGVSGLRYLNLSYTDVTDKGIKHLAKLQKLKEIDLRETAVTEQGVEELKNAIEGLRVRY